MMSVAVVTALIALSSSVNAGVLQLPIHAPEQLDLYGSDIAQNPHGRPVKSFQNLFHKTNITIGKPPQTFNVAIDTASSSFFIPSTACRYDACDPRQLHGYNSSQSSTHKIAGRYASDRFAGVTYGGFLSRDTIRLGDDATLTDHLFEEWTQSSCYSIGCINGGFDGVLGLAPPWASESQDIPNILSALLAQSPLDSPLFSLKLPRAIHDIGEILFGATNPHLNSSSLVPLPLINITSPRYLTNQWTVPASHISFATPNPLTHTLPPNGYAILDTSSPFLILPSALARNLTAAIGAASGPGPFNSVPCERRQELPSLTITLGGGHEFSISAFEYTLEIEPPREAPIDGLVCLATFMAGDEFSLPSDWEGVVLGSPFLKGFYSVWDFGRGEVGLGGLQR